MHISTKFDELQGRLRVAVPASSVERGATVVLRVFERGCRVNLIVPCASVCVSVHVIQHFAPGLVYVRVLGSAICASDGAF
jgi:hypothetical protein